jgi:carboxypeptidase Taq
MATRDAYGALEQRFHRLSQIDGAQQMLQWDLSTVMPPGGAEARAEQLAGLEVLSHELLTAPEVGDLLDAAEAQAAALDDWQAANLRAMRRDWRHATAVSAALIEAKSRASSACEMAWRAARPDDDFAHVLPSLRALMDLIREVAQSKAAAMGLAPYDALLDEWDPDSRGARITALFDDLAGFLPDFIDDVLAHQARQPAPLAQQGPFPIGAQRKLARRIVERIGFDFEHGRLDESRHPFTGGTPDDVRMTTRYDRDDFTPGLMAALHETGHALYERGLPAAWRHQPVGRAHGMSVHESQSLLIEMQACRSREFLQFAAPLLAKALARNGADPAAWDADNLYRQGIRVARSLIRVDADEVTYPAHIILRTRLEVALLAGDLDVADLPQAWRAGMQALLGVTPPDDRQGVLQDVHWYSGAFAYFPSYTLGAMMAAQLFAAATAAEPDLLPGLTRGDFAPLLAWLRRHVHSQGSRYSADELLVRATGKPLDAAVFEAHLRRRYLA